MARHPLWYSMHSRLRLRTIRALSRILDGDGWTLDLGCGSCFFLEQLRARPRAVGIDTDRASLRRWRGRGYHLVCADLRRLPFRAGQFRGEIASEVLEHLPPPADLELLREMRRVAAPGAEIVLTTPAAEGMFAATRWRNLGHTEPGTGEYHFTLNYAGDRLRELVGSAGLAIAAQRPAMRLWGTLFMDAAKLAVHARVKPREHSDLLAVEKSRLFVLYRLIFSLAYGMACLEEWLLAKVSSGHIWVIVARKES